MLVTTGQRIHTPAHAKRSLVASICFVMRYPGPLIRSCGSIVRGGFPSSSVFSGIYGVGSVSFLSRADASLEQDSSLLRFSKTLNHNRCEHLDLASFSTASFQLPWSSGFSSPSSLPSLFFILLDSIHCSMVQGHCVRIFFVDYPATSPVSILYAQPAHAR